MPETCRIYLDQMLRVEVAESLANEGHDVLRAAEVGQGEPMTAKYYKLQLMKPEFS